MAGKQDKAPAVRVGEFHKGGISRSSGMELGKLSIWGGGVMAKRM